MLFVKMDCRNKSDFQFLNLSSGHLFSDNAHVLYILGIFWFYVLDCMLPLDSLFPSSQGFIDLPSFYNIPSTHWVFRLHTIFTTRRCSAISIVSNIGNLENRESKLFYISIQTVIQEYNMCQAFDLSTLCTIFPHEDVMY